MHIKKTIMRLVDDCIYILYIIIYALGKNFDIKRISVFRDIDFDKRFLD